MPATRGLITMHYTLFVNPAVEPPHPPQFTGGGGGHVPVGYGRGYTGGRMGGAVNMRGGNVPFNYLTPGQRAGAPQKLVTVRVSFGDKDTTKEYLTPKEKAKVSVKLTGLFKAAKEAIKVVAEGLFNMINKSK